MTPAPKVPPLTLLNRTSSAPQLTPAASTARRLGHGYRGLRDIGRGSFGSTLLATSREGQQCAVKTIDIEGLDQKQKTDATCEATVLASLSHPYIVRYHESFISGGSLCIVMDFAEGGDLNQRICRAKDKAETFPEQQILKWFTQAALGLKYLHAQRVLHRDVKSQNLFLTKHEELRIGDFGIAKVMDRPSLIEDKVLGSPAYLSPEIYDNGRYSFASDVWALGCVLYEMSALRVPFEALNLPALVRRITQSPAPSLPQPYSAELRRLGAELLSQDLGQRPSCADIVQRPLIRTEIGRMLLCEQTSLGSSTQQSAGPVPVDPPKAEAAASPVTTAWAAPAPHTATRALREPPGGKKWSPQATGTLLSKPREPSASVNRTLVKSGSAAMLQGVGLSARAGVASHRRGVPPLPLASLAGATQARVEESRSRAGTSSRRAPSSFIDLPCGKDRGFAGLPSRPGSSRVIAAH